EHFAQQRRLDLVQHERVQAFARLRFDVSKITAHRTRDALAQSRLQLRFMRGIGAQDTNGIHEKMAPLDSRTSLSGQCAHRGAHGERILALRRRLDKPHECEFRDCRCDVVAMSSPIPIRAGTCVTFLTRQCIKSCCRACSMNTRANRAARHSSNLNSNATAFLPGSATSNTSAVVAPGARPCAIARGSLT